MQNRIKNGPNVINGLNRLERVPGAKKKTKTGFITFEI